MNDQTSKTLAELLAARALLDLKIEEIRAEQKKENLQYVISLVKEFHLEPREIFQNITKTKNTNSVPKYRDLTTGKTWSGRGRVPGWMVGNFEKYKID